MKLGTVLEHDMRQLPTKFPFSPFLRWPAPPFGKIPRGNHREESGRGRGDRGQGVFSRSSAKKAGKDRGSE